LKLQRLTFNMMTPSTPTTVPTVAVPLSTHRVASVAAATTVAMNGELRTAPPTPSPAPPPRCSGAC